ncbi:MAG: hypothetical protein KC466_01425 [Myxococcales bacterium]|nr:hypothetical protein [Myxococcales bacterium]
MRTFNLGEHETAIRTLAGEWYRGVGAQGFESMLADLEARTRAFRAFFKYEQFKDVPAETFRSFLWDNLWSFRDLGEEVGRRAFETLGSPKIKEQIYRMLDEHQRNPFGKVWALYVLPPIEGPVLSEILGAVYPDQYPAMHRRAREGLGRLIQTPAADIAGWNYVRFRAHADDLWTVLKEQPEYGRFVINQNYDYPYVDRFLAHVVEKG